MKDELQSQQVAKQVFASDSQLFRPFRAVGFVCDETPFHFYHDNNDSFISTSVGHSYHCYRLSDLKLIFSGEKQERAITTVAGWKLSVFTSCGPYIHRWERGHLQEVYKGHMADIYILFVFGDVLISISRDRIMKIWHIKDIGFASQSLYDSVQFPETFTPTTVMHPHTYLNKILIASEEGSMQLRNIKSKKIVYEFASVGCHIVCMEQSPALDVIGMGLSNGTVIVKNIKKDKEIVKFLHVEGGPVTSLSFRSDKKLPILATGNYSGQVAIWDLNEKKLSTIMNDVHDGPIASVKFVPGEPLLVTSGGDNALRVWIFDLSDGSGRLLRYRSGHYEPPTRIRFYNSVTDLISSGEDRTLRRFHVFQESMNQELSQGKIISRAKKENVRAEDLKAPVISSFVTSTSRERDWDNIVSIHRNSPFALTWNWQDKRIGKHKLRAPKRTVHSTAATISQCGNYTFIGYANGCMEKFNMQSGLSRGTNQFEGNTIHTESVTSICSDLLNQFIITASLDGDIKFWSFDQLRFQSAILVGSPIIQMELQRESNLLVVLCDDLLVRLYDVDTQKLVRRFTGHTNEVIDVCFTHDSRWLITSSLDCTVRVWDIITGKMIDWFKTETPVTSLAFSPTGEFLATSQMGSVGIFLWSNKNFYSNVFLRPPGDSPKILSLPAVTSGEYESSDSENDSDSSDDDSSNDDSSEESNGEPAKKRMKSSFDADKVDSAYPSKLSSDMITLSGAPRDRVKTIINLEVIKARNKPKEAPSAPKIAPFLLPTTGGIHPELDIPMEDVGKGSSGSKIINFGKLDTLSPFMKLLQSTSSYFDALQMLNDMSPSAIDLEIRQLIYPQEIKVVLHFIQFTLEEHLCFELIEALLNVVLKIHAEEIMADEELSTQITVMKELQTNVWGTLESLFHYNQCLISHLSGLQL